MKDAAEIASILGALLIPHPRDLQRVEGTGIEAYLRGSLSERSDRLLGSGGPRSHRTAVEQVLGVSTVDEEVRRLAVGAVESGVVSVGVRGDNDSIVSIGMRSMAGAGSKRIARDLARQFGSEVEVHETGYAVAQHATVGAQPCDPLHPGSAISAVKRSFGSLGGFVLGQPVGLGFLSNAHVLDMKQGGVVHQPQIGSRRIGQTFQVVAPVDGQVNTFDGGVASVDDGVSAQAAPWGAPPFGALADHVGTGDAVAKYGSCSSRTDGVLDMLGTRVAVWYGRTRMVFERQYQVASTKGVPFSIRGDSGSLVCQADGLRPFGLLFAGSRTHSWASPLEAVLVSFGVSLAGGDDVDLRKSVASTRRYR